MAIKKPVGKKALRSVKHDAAVRDDVRDTARDLLYASLGAVSISRKEGARFVGTLIEQGQELGERTVKLAEGKVADVRKQVEGVFGKVQKAANANLSQVEGVVGGQVTRVLSRLGIPSKADVQELSRRVSDLNRQVKALQGARKVAQAKAA
jgi:poly(hydroxyalkanoate) granule-associated protein